MLKLEGKVMTVSKPRTFSWIDKKTGQKRESTVTDIRMLIQDDFGVITMDPEKAKDVKPGNTIKMAVRKLEDVSGFIKIFGDVVV